MNKYMVLDVSTFETDGKVEVVASRNARGDAYNDLGKVAVVGHTYAEVSILGKLIEPRERKAISLSRVNTNGAPAVGTTFADDETEEVEVETETDEVVEESTAVSDDECGDEFPETEGKELEEYAGEIPDEDEDLPDEFR